MQTALGVFHDSTVSPAVTHLSPDWISWGRSEPCITALCTALADSWIFNLAALMRRALAASSGAWQLGEVTPFGHTQGHSEDTGGLEALFVFSLSQWNVELWHGVSESSLFSASFCFKEVQQGFLVWGDGRSCVLSFYCFVFHSDRPVCALPSSFIWKLHILAAPMVIITWCGHLLKARWGCVSLSYFILLAFGPWH